MVATKTPPAQLELNWGWVMLVVSVVTTWSVMRFTSPPRRTPEERRAKRVFMRSELVGTARAAVARRAWTKRATENILQRKQERRELLSRKLIVHCEPADTLYHPGSELIRVRDLRNGPREMRVSIRGSLRATKQAHIGIAERRSED